MEKNVDLLCAAMHLPISVLPVPGGPNKRMPFGAALIPLKMSGLEVIEVSGLDCTTNNIISIKLFELPQHWKHYYLANRLLGLD